MASVEHAHGKVAIVTGSTSGIGRGIAVRLASLGARVVVHGRDQDGARQTLAAIADAGGEGDWHRADLADAAACAGLVAFAVQRFGALDVLVNNAALTTRGDIEHAALEVIDSILAVNLRAPMLLIQAAIPHMRARGGGAVVNIGSVNAYIGEPKLCPVLGVQGRADDLDQEHRGDAEPRPHPGEPDQRRLDAHRRRAQGEAARGQGRGLARRGRRDASLGTPAVARRRRQRSRVFRHRPKRAGHRRGDGSRAVPVGAPPNW